MDKRNLKLVPGRNPGESPDPVPGTDSATVSTASLAMPGTSRAAAILPLELVDVGLVSGDVALLKEINLAFGGDRTSVILGPNGAGKTLLLRICHGLLSPTTGKVRWRDPDLAMHPAAQGMVFQKPVVLRRSVEDNIRFALKACRVERALHAGRLAHALEASGLGPLAGRRAMHLSGGERQRLSLARCLAVQHRVLFLDEPTAHLDPAATRRVEEMIALIHEDGTRVIMVTHDIGQARRLADEIVFMHRGEVLESGPATDFFARPGTAEAAAYLRGDLIW